MWCIPDVTPEFIKRMEHILELYEKPYTPEEPIICIDEKSKQLLKDSRKEKPTEKGKAKRKDYEYERNGTRNIFVAVEPKEGFRKIQVTKKRKKPDFAKFIRSLVKLKQYRDTKKIHIVLDNLNTHFEKSFYETFSQKEAEDILEKIEFHYTPKHASWLNMAEIEIGIMERQCTKGRMGTEEKLRKHLHAWKKRRNAQKEKIQWRFTRQDARKKFKYALYEPAKLS